MTLTLLLGIGISLALSLALQSPLNASDTLVLHAWVCALAVLWLGSLLLQNSLPRLPRTFWVTLALLTGLPYLSHFLSPLQYYSRMGWYRWADGIGLLFLAAQLPEEGKRKLLQILRWTGWAVLLVAAPLGWFSNPNSLAGYILLILPVALREKDRPLTLGLFLLLLWTRSMGAWLALFLSGGWIYRNHPLARRLFPGLALLAALALVYSLTAGNPSHRWFWWKSAWNMAAAAPYWGHGPETFAYIFPSFRTLTEGKTGLSSLYAHQYFLQLAAEMGLPFTLLWIGYLAGSLLRLERTLRFALGALLLHGLVDYSPSLTPHHFTLCLMLAFSYAPQGNRIPLPGRASFCALLLLAGWTLGYASFLAGQIQSTENPQIHCTQAKIHAMNYEKTKGPSEIYRALACQKRCVELNPYRTASWMDLAWFYRLAKDERQARESFARAKQLEPNHPAVLHYETNR